MGVHGLLILRAKFHVVSSLLSVLKTACDASIKVPHALPLKMSLSWKWKYLKILKEDFLKRNKSFLYPAQGCMLDATVVNSSNQCWVHWLHWGANEQILWHTTMMSCEAVMTYDAYRHCGHRHISIRHRPTLKCIPYLRVSLLHSLFSLVQPDS